MARFITLALAIAGLATGVMLYALVDNNNQGEVYDTLTGSVDWPYMVKVGLLLFGVSFMVTAVPLLAIFQFSRRRR